MGSTIANRVGLVGDPGVYEHRTADPAAIVGSGQVYWKEVSPGEHELFARDEDSGIDIVQITSGTGLNASAIDHGGLTGRGDDDHTQYALAVGRAGENLVVQGNLIVEGQRVRADSEIVLAAVNHVYMNSGYTTAVAQTGGMAVNYLPTATVDTVADAFVAGVPATSNPTVVTTGSATFSVGDLVQISNSTSNDGLFEVLTHTGTTLTVRGIGLTAAVEDFTQNDFTAEAGTGAITKVTVSVLRAGTDGLWEEASGSATGFTFVDVAIDADAIHDNVAGEITAITEKTTLTATEIVLIEDPADSNNKKRVQLSNLPAGSTALLVRKGSAGTITKGSPVYISGFNVGQNVPEVEEAKADAAGTMPAIGIAAESITNAANGDVAVSGRLSGFDTSSFSIGDLLFVSAATAGTLTATRPTGATDLIQLMGEVLRSHATMGEFEIFGAGRSNALSNLPATRIYVGDANNHPQANTDVAILSTGEFLVGRSALLQATDIANFQKDGNSDSLFGVLNETDDTAALAGLYVASGSGAGRLFGIMRAVSPSFTSSGINQADSVHLLAQGTANGLILATNDATPVSVYTNSVEVATFLSGGGLQPGSNDGGSLGAPGTAWSDLALASGAVINFGNGNYAVTHSAGLLTFNEAGADVDLRVEGDTLTHMLFMEGNAASENIALLAAALPSWQAMDRGVFIGDATTAPTGNPSAGGFLYVVSGALNWRGSSGTVTELATA